MLAFLLAKSWLLAEDAFAVTLNNVGGGNGIAVMWAQICSTLPFCTGPGSGVDAIRSFGCKVARFIFEVISGVAVCFIIYAAIKIITAQGDEGTVTQSKKTIAMAAVGLILGIIAWAVVPFVSLIISYGFGNSATPVVPLSCAFV